MNPQPSGLESDALPIAPWPPEYITTHYTHINLYISNKKAHTPNGSTAAGVSLIEYLLSNNETRTLVVLFGVSTYRFGDTQSAHIFS